MDGSDLAIFHTRRSTKAAPAMRVVRRRGCESPPSLQDNTERLSDAGGQGEITPAREVPAELLFDLDAHTS
jgi:hypothetical protein